MIRIVQDGMLQVNQHGPENVLSRGFQLSQLTVFVPPTPKELIDILLGPSFGHGIALVGNARRHFFARILGFGFSKLA